MQIEPYDTIDQFRGEDGPLKQFRKEYEEMQFKYRHLREYAMRQGIAVGELQVIVRKQFNLRYESIPYGRFEEIETWIMNNAFRRVQLLQPDLHQKFMSIEPYRNDFECQKEKLASEGF